MGRALGDMYKVADLRLVRLVTDSYFHLPFKDEESLDLIMVDVRGWAAIRWHQCFQRDVITIGLFRTRENSVYIAGSH